MAKTYAKIASPTDFRWEKEERFLEVSLDALNRFSIQQARPLLLSILWLYENNKDISLKQTKRALGYIESFTYQFNAITQSRGGSGITLMYSNLARDCATASTAQDFSDFIGKMKEKFLERDIDRDEFIVGFRQLSYSNQQPRDRLLVRYTLQRIHEHYHPSAAVDYDLYNIEHLLPQSSTESHDVYSSIGNLLFVPEPLNSKLNDKPFSDKITLIKDAGEDDPFILGWQDATADAIRARAKALAELAFDKVWSL